MESGARHREEKSSALWGGRGDAKHGGRRPVGRRLVPVAFAALIALTACVASAVASPPPGRGPNGTYVDPALLDQASSNPNGKIRVIIQSRSGLSGAENALNSALGGSGDGHLGRELSLVGGVAAELKAKKLTQLAALPGLTITQDVPTAGAGSFTSNQLWPGESGNQQLWNSIDAKSSNGLPAIAVVDSGIDTSGSDFTGRVVANVNLATAQPQSPGDGRGHGTFVAGIAAGAAPGYAGAAPGAPIASIRVMNDNGMAWTSDVIAACQWILANESTYNIRVANFSLHTNQAIPFYYDPLVQAVEKLWLNGVVVVAAAGNYGDGTPVGVKYAPGDDPFVITVGAVDLNGTARLNDDFVAPWSAFGYTLDGFRKPEISADGRYMVGPVPGGSTLVGELAGQIVAPGYMQLSGTSFAAPVVAGAAAHVLALHPGYTPDQVKGALMITARALTGDTQFAGGVGEVNAIRAATYPAPPNPNLALDSFLIPDPTGGSTPVFDAANWNSTVQLNASWNSASWNSASWNSASWNSASWNSASWNSASWNSASWNSASWNSNVSTDVSSEAAMLGDANSTDGYPLTPEQEQALADDPDLTPLVPLP